MIFDAPDLFSIAISDESLLGLAYFPLVMTVADNRA